MTTLERKLTRLFWEEVVAKLGSFRYTDGYDDDEGAKYAQLLDSFFKAVTPDTNPWTIEMSWYPGGSNLIATRTVSQDGGFSQVETHDIAHPLDRNNSAEAKEAIGAFIHDLIRLAERIGMPIGAEEDPLNG